MVSKQIEALLAIRPAFAPALTTSREKLAQVLEACSFDVATTLNKLLQTETKETMGVKIVAFGEGPYGLLLKERAVQSIGKGATVVGFADKSIAETNDIHFGDMIVSINLIPVIGMAFKELMDRLRKAPRPVFLGFRTFL